MLERRFRPRKPRQRPAQKGGALGQRHRCDGVGGAAAADQLSRRGASGEFSGDPVAVFDPAVCGFPHCRIIPEHVQDLAPEPFARIDAALVFAEVGAVPLRGETVDPGRLVDCGVVLPEQEHRVGIFRKVGAECERDAVGVDRTGRRTGGVHRDAGHPAGIGFPEDPADGRFHPFNIVQRMLAETVLRGVAVATIPPAGVVVDAGGKLFSCFGDQHGPDAVRSEVEADQGAV